MVSVEYPDLSGEAENAENPNQLSGVPRGARPAGESADQVQARDMSFDVDTDDLNQVAYENREAVNIAAENFRRFTNGLNLIMAFRLLSSEKMATLLRVKNEARSHQGAPRSSEPLSPIAANADSIEAEDVVSDDVVSSSSAVAAATYAPTRGPISSVSADSTLADVRVMQMQHEIQLAKMNANMALQAARFEETMKRVELQSRFDLLQAQSRLDSQAAVATAQLKAAEQMKDHMQAAEAAHLQAMADRLAIPREQRAIKDIYSGALVRCPIDKGKDEFHEWTMALAAAASGLCEVASDIVMKVMARDATVLAFASEPDNVQADRWLARQINTSIKEDTEAGKLFHKEARQDAAICRSGVRLLDKAYKTVTKSNPLKLDMAERKMATTIYFSGGMSLDQTKLAAAQFKSDHTELGSRRSQDDLAIFKAMLKELPPALLEPHSMVVRDLLWEMEESTMISEPLITFDKLIIKMAIMLRNVQGAAKKEKEVNSSALTYAGAAKGKGKGKGAAKGATPAKGKGGKGAPGKGSGGKGATGMSCAVCGKANVLTSACTCPPCVRCKFRFCPGAPGARAITGLGCVFDLLKFPEHKLVTQANGPIPKSLYEKAGREYSKYWGVPYEASAAEASVIELDEGTLRLEEEKGYVLEGSVCEMEISSSERGIHTIVNGHPELLKLLGVMYLDNESNTPMLPGYETVLLDDGANVMLIVSKKMLEAAQAQSWTSQAAIASVVKGPKLRLEGEASITMYPLCAGGAHGLMQLQGHKASGARRNIVPPQLLEKSLGATINYHATKYGPPSYDVAFPSGEEWLVLEYNDLFFAFVKVGSDPVLPRNLLRTDIGAETEINEAEINSAGMLCSLDPRIWASRLATGSDGVKAIKKAVKGMEAMRTMTASDIHVIEHDRHRLAQTAKRKPTNVTRDPKERIFTPGTRFVIDVKTYSGKDQVTQIADRTGVKAPTSCIMAIDDSDSNYVYSFNSDTHTTEVLINFLSHVVAAEKMLGHEVKVFKFDRAPEIDCETLKRRVESKLHVRVLIGPSGEHECVARAEALMDITSRATEAMIQRAKRNLGSEPRRFQALATKYAVWLNNRRPDKDGKPTHMQRHCGRVPDFGDKNGMTPFVFGCKVIRLRDEIERTNWKGAGKRVADGIFVGIEHSSYIVYNPETGRLTFEPFIWALDELELSRTGMAAGASQHDAACQIEISTAEPLVLLPPKNSTRMPAPKAPAIVIDAPIGTRIKVFWQGVKGQPELDKWYEGTIMSISTLANSQLRHTVKYDGWGDIEHVHDLVNGGKPWLRLGAPPTTAIESTSLLIPVGGDELSEPVPAPIVPPSTQIAEQWETVGQKRKPALKAADAQPTRHSTRVTFAPSAPPAKTQARTTRHSGSTVSVAELTSSALERTQATPGMAQIIVEHLMGDDAPDFVKGDTVETILERVADVPFKPDQRVPADIIALEASGTQIEYVTEAGTLAVKDQPKGYAQVMASPDRDEWLEASRQSFVGLKNVRGNKMRRIEEATVEGPIFDVVSVYRIKLDPSTNKLDRVTVRHNVDGNRGKRVLARLGIAYAVPTSSTTLDEVAFKMIISDSAKRLRYLTKADVKSAYTNAATSRGKRFLRCPDTAPEFDEDGTEMVLELGPPLFGEPEAGYEWQMTLEKDLTELGWTPFENVPCMWRFETKDNDCILGTIVDDLLFSEATGHALADATIEALRKKYVGVTSEHNPTAFAGYKLEQSPERDVITISLPELIEQKFKMECPELVPAEARAKFKLEHTKGSKLQKLADALEMVPLNPSGKVTATTKIVQTLTGNLRYFTRAAAGELNVLTHRLSCVQASAPPEAIIVAKAGMILAYETRHRGITYSKLDVSESGGDLSATTATGVFKDYPRQTGIHAVADASWGDKNIYGCIVMMNYGVIVAETKKMGPVDSSAQAEGIASSKCAEILENVREIARGMGILSDEPTVLRSDNLSSVRVSNDPKSAGRLRHALRRYATLQARVARGEVNVIHVPDEYNAADFLTKWVPAIKLKESVAYTSNAAAKKGVKRGLKDLEASAAEFMTLRSGKRKFSASFAEEATPAPSPLVDAPPPMVFLYYGVNELFGEDEMEVEEVDEAADPPEHEVSVADLDPYYSDTESDLLTEAGDDAWAPWVTGAGPAMHAFASFDDFVYYYRIYEATDAMWHAWNAAQDYEVEDFEEAVPDSIIILKS
jgi:hypothetical protein